MSKLFKKKKLLSEIKGSNLTIPDTSIYAQLLKRGRIHASKIVSRCHEDELSFSRMKYEVELYAKAFLNMGVKIGDIVPICIPPCNEGIIAFLALNKIGAISSFMNITASKAELKKYIEMFGSSYLIISTKYTGEIEELICECALRSVLVISPADAFADISSISELTKEYIASSVPAIKHDVVHTLAAFKEIGKSFKGTTSIPIKKSMPAFIAYTSGTTGTPKAILFSNENILAEMISLKKTTGMRLGPSGNCLQIVPFNYPYGFIISTLFPLFVGKTAALTPMLTIETIPDYLKMYTPTYINGIPHFYMSFYLNEQIRQMDLSFLKYAVSGGDKFDLTEKLKINEFLKKHGSTAKILDGSGNGEGCGSLTNPLSLFSGYNPASIGKPIYGLSVKFIDQEGNVVGLGETGRFCFAGKNVMMGYFGQPNETRKSKHTDSDGIEWFVTDTFGHMDAKKWIYFDGRERRFFITYDSSGSPYKVYCDHVQGVIKKSGYVLDCAVVQKPDPKRYLVPVAFICIEKKANFNEKVILIHEFCSNDLQSCAAPVEYIQIDTLPMTAAGKVNYSALEEMAVNKECIQYT